MVQLSSEDPPENVVQALINLFSQGKTQAVLNSSKALLKQFPKSALIHNIKGASLAKLERYDESIKILKKAISLKPNYADSYINLGNTFKAQGKLDVAIKAFNKATSLNPDNADVYYNLGVVLKDQGKLNEVIKSYNKALSIKPNYLNAWLNGAETLEKWNKLEELDVWLKRAALAFEPIPADLMFYQAKLLWRNKKYEAAVKIINNIDLGQVTEHNKQAFLNLRAKSFESLKDFDQAFQSFAEMNSLAKKSNSFFKSLPEQYFKNAEDQLTNLKLRPVPIFNDYHTEPPNYDPVFLVGFPRSGTTLLDTIMRSHSSIRLLEEQPTIASARTYIEKSPQPDYVNRLLPSKTLSRARQIYRNELNKYLDEGDMNAVIIDKLPLNLLATPLIKQLYPDAKFILVLRHPMDTILSCWTQDFKLNAAMANMVDLDRIVDLYCIAMETFKQCSNDYNLNVYTIKYEGLVENLREETSMLLKFLNLKWEPQMKNYQDTALKRGRINTPSYAQVVQPIYQDAKYRWLNYEKYLKQYLEKVGPWIDDFGYDDSQITAK